MVFDSLIGFFCDVWFLGMMVIRENVNGLAYPKEPQKISMTPRTCYVKKGFNRGSHVMLSLCQCYVNAVSVLCSGYVDVVFMLCSCYVDSMLM